jgi:hypothetical protein
LGRVGGASRCSQELGKLGVGAGWVEGAERRLRVVLHEQLRENGSGTSVKVAAGRSLSVVSLASSSIRSPTTTVRYGVP